MVQHERGYAGEREHGGARYQPAAAARLAARRLGAVVVTLLAVLLLLPVLLLAVLLLRCVRGLLPVPVVLPVRLLGAAGLRLLSVRLAVLVAVGRLRDPSFRPVRLVLLPVGCVRHVRWLSGCCCPRGAGWSDCWVLPFEG
ncbi:hypothetical protein GCM10010425_12270 [Streptomyces spororaveus]|uniref:Uncharacterized protein n=1 Tax=Streptomyces spororaveus TaxID=284039 RepID=A0ABQ3T4R0_9ACTN|nr:hypothetical protein Sspor_09390 [Streptomyces spororaveus]